MIQQIAVLLTCHNRKDKTINCLKSLFVAYKMVKDKLLIKVFLTDDGSIDGTADAVKNLFPDTIIIQADGNLFWAGGMRSSWTAALKYKFDAYLLLNDDTNVTDNLFTELLAAHQFALDKYNIGGVYIGSTYDDKHKFSYGGSVIKNRFMNTYQGLAPNGKVQECDLGNANIMMVASNVVTKIGILSDLYTHALADFDYTLSARHSHLPVLIAPNYCGTCNRDHADKYQVFANLPFDKRRKFLFHPKGLALSAELNFMKKFYPFRVPIILAGASLKLIFPKFYIGLSRLRNHK